MTDLKLVKVDARTEQGILRAESEKSRMENAGFSLRRTIPVGFDRWLLEYAR